MKRGCRSLLVAMAVTFAACSGSSTAPPTTTVPATTIPTITEPEPTSPPETSPPTDMQPVEAGDETLVVKAEPFEPTTATEDLLLRIAEHEEPTVQDAIDAFSLAYTPLPGATSSGLPPGEGPGTTTALMLINRFRDQLTPEQLAIVDSFDGPVAEELSVDPDGTVHRPDGSTYPSSPTTTAPTTAPPTATDETATSSAPTTSPTTGSTAAPRGFRAASGRRPGAPDIQVEAALWVADAALRLRAEGLEIPAMKVRILEDLPKEIDPASSVLADATPPTGTELCSIRLFPALFKLAAKDSRLVEVSVAHEIFHCIQFSWNPDVDDVWLMEGSATWASYEAYKEHPIPEPVLFDEWFTTPKPLVARADDSWALYEIFEQRGGDAFEAIHSAFAGGPTSTTTYLERMALTADDFALAWSSMSTRSTEFTPAASSATDNWYTTTNPDSIPTDQYADRGPIEVAHIYGVELGDWGHTAIRYTPHDDVGLVAVTAVNVPLRTHTVLGDLDIPPGVTEVLCFDDSRCECEEGYSTLKTYPVDEDELTLAIRPADVSRVYELTAGEWDDDQFCDTGDEEGDDAGKGDETGEKRSKRDRKRRGEANGDLHVRTFDGYTYDLMSGGEFVLASDSRGDLEVQIRQEIRDGASTVTAVGIRAGGHHFFLRDFDTMTVDGRPWTPDEGDVGDLGITVDAAGPFGIPVLTIQLPDGTTIDAKYVLGWFVSVSVTEERFDRVDGLLGTPNGQFTDDVKIDRTSGLGLLSVVEDIEEVWGPRWYVDPAASLMEYLPGETSEGFRSPPPQPPPISDEHVERCADALPEGAIDAEVEACAWDLAATGDDGYIGAYEVVVDRRVETMPDMTAVALGPAPDPAPATTTAPADVTAHLVLTYDESQRVVRIPAGSVVLVRTPSCPPDEVVSVQFDSDEASGSLYPCDPIGLTYPTEPGVKIEGESAGWTQYEADYRVWLSDPDPTTIVEVFVDPAPTVVRAETVIADGYEGSLAGVGDSVAFEVETGEEWYDVALEGFDDPNVCSRILYGWAINDQPSSLGGPQNLGWCAQRSEIDFEATYGTPIAFVVWSRTDEPVDISLTATLKEW